MANEHTNKDLQDIVMGLIRQEFNVATEKFGSFASGHEGFAVLEEEFLELREAVFLNWERNPDKLLRMTKEAVQVGAMAARFLHDICAKAILDG